MSTDTLFGLQYTRAYRSFEISGHATVATHFSRTKTFVLNPHDMGLNPDKNVRCYTGLAD